jgi:XamI restriction endonuclease
MTIPNVSNTPRIWNDQELTDQASVALNEFVDRRLAEPGGKYLTHIQQRRRAIVRLFKVLNGVDQNNPDAHTVRELLVDNELFDALRYIAGPPISKDDLGVLVTRDIKGISKGALRNDDELPGKVLQLICRLADPYRFPWVADRRPARKYELRAAIRSTMTLHAAQTLATERRGYGKLVERRLETRLIELGFTNEKAPNKGQISAPIHYPKFPQFYSECTVHGRKVDLFIALPDGRMIAVEAKDSSSGLNSVKRILNDTAAKARHFTAQTGKTIITTALLSGVFKVESLKKAQESDLYLVWSHDLDGFVQWIKTQT